MAFMGKVAYLALFPGALFVLFAGTAARSLLNGLSQAVAAGPARGPANGLPAMYGLLSGESIRSGGSFHAVYWLAPALKLFCLSWASCLILGFLEGDWFLLFVLLVASSVGDLLLCITSQNPRVSTNAMPEALSLLAWSAPLAFVLAGTALRTGTTGVSSLVDWQAANGVLLGSTSGGTPAVVGTALSFAAASFSALLMMRFKPLGRNYYSEAPHGSALEMSGAPLAMLRAGEAATLFVAPILVVSVFFGAPASTWYQVVFWALKIVGVLIVLGLVDLVCTRSHSNSLLAWSACVASAVALVGLILIWTGAAL